MSRRQAHHSPASKKNEAGFDSLTGAAMSRTVSRNAAFSLPVCAQWAGRAGSRKARRCSTGLSTRSVPPTPFDSGRRFVNRTGAHTMSKITPTADIEFCKRLFDHHPEDVIAPLGYASEAFGWLEELFRTIATAALNSAGAGARPMESEGRNAS